MQTNNNQENQLPKGRAEKIHLDELINKFHLLDFYDQLRSSIKEVLNANIGKVTSQKPKRTDISDAVTLFYQLFKFHKSLLKHSGIELNSLSTDKLMILAKELDENEVEDVVFDCLAIWIYDYFNELATADFAKDVSSKFKALNLFIDECEKIGNALEEMEVSNG